MPNVMARVGQVAQRVDIVDLIGGNIILMRRRLISMNFFRRNCEIGNHHNLYAIVCNQALSIMEIENGLNLVENINFWQWYVIMDQQLASSTLTGLLVACLLAH